MKIFGNSLDVVGFLRLPLHFGLSLTFSLSPTRDCSCSPLSNPSLFLSFFTKFKYYKPPLSSLAPLNRLKSFFKIWKIPTWNPRTSRTSFAQIDPNFFYFQSHFNLQSLSHLSNFISTDLIFSTIINGFTTTAYPSQASSSKQSQFLQAFLSRLWQPTFSKWSTGSTVSREIHGKSGSSHISIWISMISLILLYVVELCLKY